jgi:hypothetical protein
LIRLEIPIPTSGIPDLDVIPDTNQHGVALQVCQAGQIRRNPSSPLAVYIDRLCSCVEQPAERSDIMFRRGRFGELIS